MIKPLKFSSKIQTNQKTLCKTSSWLDSRRTDDYQNNSKLFLLQKFKFFAFWTSASWQVDQHWTSKVVQLQNGRSWLQETHGMWCESWCEWQVTLSETLLLKETMFVWILSDVLPKMLQSITTFYGRFFTDVILKFWNLSGKSTNPQLKSLSLLMKRSVKSITTRRWRMTALVEFWSHCISLTKGSPLAAV